MSDIELFDHLIADLFKREEGVEQSWVEALRLQAEGVPMKQAISFLNDRLIELEGEINTLLLRRRAVERQLPLFDPSTNK